jgi:hypothetical protein
MLFTSPINLHPINQSTYFDLQSVLIISHLIIQGFHLLSSRACPIIRSWKSFLIARLSIGSHRFCTTSTSAINDVIGVDSFFVIAFYKQSVSALAHRLGMIKRLTEHSIRVSSSGIDRVLNSSSVFLDRYFRLPCAADVGIVCGGFVVGRHFDGPVTVLVEVLDMRLSTVVL